MLNRSPFAGLRHAVPLSLLLWGVIGLGVAGCLSKQVAHGDISAMMPVPTVNHPAGEFAYVSWLAAITLTIAVGLFIASFWVPTIATKTAVSCLLASIGLWALKYALEKYLHIAVTVGVIIAGIAGAVALFPIAHTWVNLHLRGMAKKVEAVNPQAAAVLKEVADGGVGLASRLRGLASGASAPEPVVQGGKP